MSRLLRWLAVPLFALTTSFAQAGTADISLTAIPSASPPYRVGQTITVTLTVANAGPDTAGAAWPPSPIRPVQVSTTYRVDEDNELALYLTPSLPSLCTFEEIPFDPIPGEREGLIFVVSFPNIAPNTSAACDVTMEVLKPTPTALTWLAWDAADVDPDASNNASSTVVSFETIPVPSLSMAAAFCLVALLTGVARARRN